MRTGVTSPRRASISEIADQTHHPHPRHLSHTTLLSRCVAAVNGGDFTWSEGWHTPLDQRCSRGVLVCNSSTWSADPSVQPVFAMSSSCDMYVGNFPYSLFASAGIVNAVSGQAVIVRNGSAQPCVYAPSPLLAAPPAPPSAFHSLSSSVNAPRTALGHDLSGRVMTLQVDGDESEDTGTLASAVEAFSERL